MSLGLAIAVSLQERLRWSEYFGCRSEGERGLQRVHRKRRLGKEKGLFERNMDREARGQQGTREEWLGIVQTLAEQIQKEQQTAQKMTEEMVKTYMQLLSSRGSYLRGQADQRQ